MKQHGTITVKTMTPYSSSIFLTNLVFASIYILHFKFETETNLKMYGHDAKGRRSSLQTNKYSHTRIEHTFIQ